MPGNQAAAINKKPKTVRKLMLDFSLPMASFLYDLSNLLLLIGALAVALGTYGSIQMGSVKEQFADERIAENEAETARALESAAQAGERAAEADARAAEANHKAEQERLARLKIEAQLAPRSLSASQQSAIIARIIPFAPTQFEFVSYQDDQEIHGWVLTLVQTLLAAGWRGSPAREMLFGGLVVGVVVEFAPNMSDELGQAAHTLAEALNAESIAVSAVANAEMASHPDRVRIKVGRKP